MPDRRRKHFVLDTNVLLHNSAALRLFDDNHVVIPFAVVEELDTFKKNNDDNGRSAREVIRQLDALRKKGKLNEGIVWNDHGGTVRIVFAHDADAPPNLRLDSPDNRIISVAWKLQEEGLEAVLVTKDINVRIRTDALGIPTEDFEAQKVDADRMYRGYEELAAPDELIDELYAEKQLEIDVRASRTWSTPPATKASRTRALRRSSPTSSSTSAAPDRQQPRGLGPAAGRHRPPHPDPEPAEGRPRHRRTQRAADDGAGPAAGRRRPAGDAAGLRRHRQDDARPRGGMTRVVQEDRYDKLLVARPIMPMGRDIGYLPGDKDEKLGAWMQPIFDNLEYLLSRRGVGSQHAESRAAETRVEQLMAQGKVVLEPLTYIRGRSIPNNFMIVDEAQNLTPHEVKTIVSRVGEGTKIILTGDVNQIDNPYLDTASNGLAYLIERLKGHPLVGHVTLAKSERSELASLAAERL